MKSPDSYIFDKLLLSGETETSASQFAIGLMRFITHLGDGLFLVAVSICFLTALIFRRLYKVSILWTLTIAFSFVFSASLKSLIGRNRPDEIYHLIEVSSPALPSGHALKSTVVYIGIYILISRFFTFPSSQNKWMKLLFVLPLLIGLSRLCLGVHWPSDVLAGWALGIVISWVFYKYSAKLN